MPGFESRWTEKYRPKALGEVLGNGKAVEELLQWAESWRAGSPITGAAILYGPAGTGKTSAALALAREFEWDHIEMNASDARTAGMIQRIAGPASRSGTFSGQKRLVILDEADNLHGTADRGGAAAMLRLVRETNQPVLLIANEYYEIEKPLRDAAKGIQFRSIRSTTVAHALRSICMAEEIACDGDAVDMIAERAGGDLRSAVNDLQAAAEGQSLLAPEDVATAERDVKASIFKVLEVIFKGQKASEAQAAAYDLDESPEDLIQWVDENLPLAYRDEDLFRGYENLARADVFLGRVSRRQNYGLWRYAGFLMTGGVQAAKAKVRHGYVAFRPPGLWRRLGQSRKARGVRDSAAMKIAHHCHVSAALARAELMGFVGMLLRDKKLAAKVAAELDLLAEEIALLMESTPATKKVQAVFEEAQRIREAEAVEDIELAWHRTAQRPLERASVASEQAKMPETKRQGKEMEGGRSPKKKPLEALSEKKAAEREGKKEKTTDTMVKESPRRQRSLFDF
ncbi:MAG TPA: replication factor C large subunit [Methanothrix sp.]|nr:replication factor C large subunit [Methanothrix sp.]